MLIYVELYLYHSRCVGLVSARSRALRFTPPRGRTRRRRGRRRAPPRPAAPPRPPRSPPPRRRPHAGPASRRERRGRSMAPRGEAPKSVAYSVSAARYWAAAFGCLSTAVLRTECERQVGPRADRRRRGSTTTAAAERQRTRRRQRRGTRGARARAADDLVREAARRDGVDAACAAERVEVRARRGAPMQSRPAAGGRPERLQLGCVICGAVRAEAARDVRRRHAPPSACTVRASTAGAAAARWRRCARAHGMRGSPAANICRAPWRRAAARCTPGGLASQRSWRRAVRAEEAAVWAT